MRSLISASGLIIVVNMLGFAGSVPRYEPGVLVAQSPQQYLIELGAPLPNERKIPLDGILLRPLAEYKISARIVARSSYWLGREAEVSPLDLGLAWGPMSDQNAIDALTFGLSLRYLRWTASDLPAVRDVIESHISNNHIIPANEQIAEQLKQLSVGKLVELQGKLVRAEATDGWSWTSSLARTDVGQGSCELFYVEKISLLTAANRQPLNEI